MNSFTYADKIKNIFSGGVLKAFSDSAFLKNLNLGISNAVQNPYTLSEEVYICVSTTARAISQVPLEILQPANDIKTDEDKRILFETKMNVLRHSNHGNFGDKYINSLIRKGEWEAVEATNPWQQLFDAPNPYDDSLHFKEKLIGLLMLDGNVFILPMPFITSPTVVPDDLWVVQKKNIELDVNKDTGQLVNWKYQPEGATNAIHIPFEYICHLKLWNPNHPIWGQRPLEAGKIAVSSDYKASVYNEKFFEQSAVPKGVLTAEKALNDKIFNRVKEQFKNEHQGYRNANKIAILEGGLSYTPTGLTQKEMEFKELRGMDKKTIRKIFGMKDVIVSETETLNKATATIQRKSWWEDTNLPFMRLVASAINMHILLHTPYIARWNTLAIEALQENLDDKIKSGEKLLGMGYDANEINDRLELGFEHHDDRERKYIKSNLKEVGVDDVEEDDDSEIIIPEEEIDIDEGQESEKVNTDLDTALADIETDVKFKIWEKQVEIIWKAIIRDIRPVEEKLQGKTKKIMFEIRQKVLKRLYRNAKGYSIDKEIVTTADEMINWIDSQNTKTEKALMKKHAKVAHEEATTIGAETALVEMNKLHEIGISFDIDDPIVTQYLRVKALKVTNVIDSAYGEVRRGIVEGQKEGESINQIAKRIKSAVDGNVKRARTIARTEVLGSMNFGRSFVMSETDFKKKIWFTALDERVRGLGKNDADHVAMHGTTKLNTMETKWHVPNGGAIRFPGDYLGEPKNIINCRCIEVVDEDSYKPAKEN